MKFEDHLGEFLGDSVDKEEARQLAVAAVAGSLRRTKLAIAEQLWQARQFGSENPDSGANALGTARMLKGRLELALAEYRRLSGEGVPEPELRVLEGGQDGADRRPADADGGA